MVDEVARLGVDVDSSSIIAADMRLDALTDAAIRTEKAVDDLGQEFRQSSREIENLNQRIGSTVGNLRNAAAGLAAALGLREAVSTVSDFGASVSNLSAITGAVGEDLEFLSSQAADIGRTTTLSASQAVTAFKLVASAKPDLLESTEALNAVTREAVALSEAAGISLPDAAQSLGKSLNQFQTGAEDASRFINVLAAGAKFGSSEIANTAAALDGAGTVAAAAGISFEATNAAIQNLAQIGVQGAEAGTSLRNIFAILQKQTSEFNPEVVGLTGALRNLADENLSTVDAIKIFGLENFVAAQQLIRNADSIDELTEKLTGTSTAYEQAALNTDNLSGDFKGLQSAIEGVTLALLPEDNFRPFVQGARDSINEFTDFVPSLRLAFEGVFSFFDIGLQRFAIFTLTLNADIEKFEVNFSRFFSNLSSGIEGLFDQAADNIRVSLASVLESIGEFSGGLPGLSDTTDAILGVAESLRIASNSAQQTAAESAKANAEFDQEIANIDASLESLLAIREANIAAAMVAIDSIQAEQGETANLVESVVDLSSASKDATTGTMDLGDAAKSAAGDAEDFSKEIDQIVKSVNELEVPQAERDLDKLAIAIQQASDAGDPERVIMLQDAFFQLAGTLEDSRIEDDARELQNLIDRLDPAAAAARDFASAQDLLNRAQELGIDLGDRAGVIYANLQQEYEKAAESTDDFTAAFERGLERLDDIGANFWNDFFDDGRISLSSVKDLALQTFAEIAQAATRRIFLNFGIGGPDGGLSGIASSIIGGGGAGVPGATPGIIPQDFVGPVRPSAASGISNFFERNASVFTGAAIGGLSASLVGSGFAESIGGAIGGAALSAGFEATLSQTLGAFAGPLGGIVGGVLGGLIGGLFGGRDPRIRVSGAQQRFAVNDPTDTQFETALGIVRISLRKFEREALQPIVDQITEFDNAIGSAIDDDRLPALQQQLVTFFSQDKGNDPDLNEILRDRFDFIVNALGGELASLIGRAGSDINDAVIRLQEVFAVDRFVAESDLLGDSLTGVVRLLEDLQIGGENLSQTLERVAQQTIAFDQVIDLFGLAFDGTREDAARTAQAISDAFGGVDALVDAVGRYEAAIGRTESATDQASALIDQVQALNESLGLIGDASISTRAELDNFVRGLDLTTEAGQQAFKFALDGAEAIAQFDNFVDDFAGTIERLNIGFEGTQDQALLAAAGIIDALGSLEEFERAAVSLGIVTDELGLQFNSSIESITAAAEGINSIFGSIEAFARQAAEFDQLTSPQVTQDQSAAQAARDLGLFNQELGLSGDAAIDTRAELRAYAQSLDVTTEAGQRALMATFDIAESLAIYEDSINSLNQSLGLIREFADIDLLDAYNQAQIQGSRNLREQLDFALADLSRVSLTFDGTRESILRLDAAARTAFQAALESLQALDSILQATGLEDTRRSIEESLLGADELYERRRAEIAELSSRIGNVQSPEELQAISQEVEALTNSAFGILSEEQRQLLGPEFLSFLDEIQAQIQGRAQELRDITEEDFRRSQEGLPDVETLALEEIFANSADTFASSVDEFRQTITDFLAAGVVPGTGAGQRSDLPEPSQGDNQLPGGGAAGPVTRGDVDQAFQDVGGEIAAAVAQAISQNGETQAQAVIDGLRQVQITIIQRSPTDQVNA